MKKSVLFEAILSILLIILIFAMYLMVTSGSPSSTEMWSVPGIVASPDNTVYGNVFTGDNGMLYTVDGKSIHAIDSNGSIAWSYAIPDIFLPGQGNGKWIGEKMATDDKNDLYIIVSADPDLKICQLLAISPDGNLLWNRTQPVSSMQGAPDIKVHGDRLYYFTGSEEYILDLNGNEVKWINDVYGRTTVDENGTLYVIPGMFECNSIQAYDPNGSLLWSHSFDEYGTGNITVPQYANTPVYINHTIYVWMEHGALALDQNGNLKWKVPFNNPGMSTEWLDSNGDVYIVFKSLNGPPAYTPPSVLVLHPDGSNETLVGGAIFNEIFNARVISGGVAYDVDMVGPRGAVGAYEGHEGYEDDLARYYKNDSATQGLGMPKLNELPNDRNIASLDTYNISAYDVKTGAMLRSYRLTLSPRSIVLNASNVNGILIYGGNIATSDNAVTPEEWYRSRNIPEGAKMIGSYSWLDLKPTKDMLYVNFWTYNYEVPTFYNQSKGVYSGGIYAFDKDGRLAWDQSTDSRVTYMEEKNGTIYYGTGNGRVSASSVNLAAGVAILAALYLFIRFFMVGAVSRARDRLDKNDNRNRVLQFIVRNPGATMYDVSRGLAMNLGTARYHLLILGINHRITAHKTDLKYVRYFTNSGSYTGEEQLAMALIRREGVRKILGLLIEKPGMSHTRLAEALGMPESSLSRYMKELSEKGIIDRETDDVGMSAYFVNNGHKQAIASMMERLSD